MTHRILFWSEQSLCYLNFCVRRKKLSFVRIISFTINIYTYARFSIIWIFLFYLFFKFSIYTVFNFFASIENIIISYINLETFNQPNSRNFDFITRFNFSIFKVPRISFVSFSSLNALKNFCSFFFNWQYQQILKINLN